MSFNLPEIPSPKSDDPEDVSWALSTAEAMWSRGDHAEAIKWIRRGAEAASEAEADDRALELAKAAADLASMIVRMSHSGENTSEEPPPPLPPPGPGSMRVPPAMQPQSFPPSSLAYSVAANSSNSSPSSPPPSVQPMSQPAQVPVTARSVPPPPMAQPQGQRASVHPATAPASVPPPGNAPRAQAQNAGNQAQRAPRPLQASRGPDRPQSTNKGVLAARTESKRRRSNANLLDEEARTEGGGAEKLSDKVERAAREAMRVDFRKTTADAMPPEMREDLQAARAAHESEPSQEPSREDASRELPERPPEDSPNTRDDGRHPPAQEHPQEQEDNETTRAIAGTASPPRKKRKSRSNEMRVRSSSATDEWDAHPTQSLSRAELDSITNEHSLAIPPRRNGEAPGEPARSTSHSTHPSRGAPNEEPQPIVASQAVRVVLWRDADGVHVAPAGTVVSAIKVDAILVALDPSADLSTWLDPRRMR